MTAISYHDTVNDLQGLDWVETGPFARLGWFRLLEIAGIRPVLALARDGDEAVCLPLRRDCDTLVPLANWYAFTWGQLRTRGALRDDLLEELARHLARQAPRIVLDRLADEDGTLERLQTAFRKAGWLTFAEPCDVNHVLDLNGRSYSDYLATRPGPLRTTLKRKAKKVEIKLSQQFSQDDWKIYEEIYQQSWKPEEGDPALLRDFAQAESAAGRLRFGIARHEGEPVAAQFWTVDGATAYIHKLAHLPDAQKLSPGTSLTAALFEHVIDVDKVRMVDFGTGDDPYKRDWMEEVRSRYRLICLRPEAPRNWPRIGKAILRNLVSRGAHG